MDRKKFDEEIECFKKHLVLQYSLRKITINNHLGNIKRMLKIIQTNNPEKEEITNYVYELKNSGKSASHISNNISSIEKYMEFKKKLVRYSKPRRQQKMITDILTEAEISRMIRACKNIKEITMMIILCFSGVRNSSFCNIKVKDIDFGNNLILVKKVKGRKEYAAHMPSDSIPIVLKYLEKYPKKPDEFLFTTKIKGNQYNIADIRKFVKNIANRARIEKRVYPHLLRHSLASNMRKRGADIILIKEQMGHDYIESTMVYLTCFPDRIKSEYEIYKPTYI